KNSYSVRVRVTDQGGLTFEQPFTIAVTDVNDAPVLGGVTTPISYTENATLFLATAGTVADVDSPNLDTGKLTVTITSNAGANDRLAIQNQGAGVGRVGVTGSNVTFSGTVIGTVAGGVGTAALVVTFNASATPAAAQAVLRNVTYSLLDD